MSVLSECVSGPGPCRSALASKFTGPNRRAIARAWAEENNLPATVGDDIDLCLSGDSKACARAAAAIAAVGACDAATGGACPECCGALVGPVLAVLWPIVGPVLEGISEGAVALISAGLESLGLKEEPDFGDDVAEPMRREAKAQFDTMVSRWLQKYPSGGNDLDAELNRTFANSVGFSGAWWYPTNYGIVELVGGNAWTYAYSLEWSKAWERDDAFSAGADALAIGYSVRLEQAVQAIARATGRQLAKQRKLKFVRKFRVKQTTNVRAVVVTVGATAGCATLVGLAWWMVRR